MKRSLASYIFIAILLVTGSCGSKTPTPSPSEATLVVSLNPPANSTQPPAPQVDFPLSVTITSTMPPQGVNITVTAKREDNSAVFFAPPVTSTSGSSTNFSITGTPIGVVCITTVTVQSKSLASNTWTGTYRYSRKS